MKKLIALLAVLGFVPYAYAADGADFSHSGEFRLQYQNDMNKNLDDDVADSPIQNWHQRLRWGTNVRAGEKMNAHFTLVHNADWGSNADQTPDGVSGLADADGDGNIDAGETIGTENLLIVNEAYMSWMVNDSWMIRAGRGAMTMADGRFVSANEFEAVQKAFDGAMATWDHEMVRLSLFAVEGVKGAAFNSFGRFYGVAADFKTLPSFLKAAHVHVVQVKRDMNASTALTAKQDNMKIGAMISGDMAGADYRLNYEMEDGEDKAVGGNKTDISTSMIDVEAGFTLAAMMNTRLFLGYHMDSGNSKTPTATTDDETYDGFHYDSHDNAGLMDVVGWGNLTYMRFGLGMQPADDITVGFEYLMFTQTEKKDNVYGGTIGGAAGATAGDATEDDIGSEWDVWVTKKYTNNFNISARYGMFSPGDEFKAANQEDAYSQIYVESKLTF